MYPDALPRLDESPFKTIFVLLLLLLGLAGCGGQMAGEPASSQAVANDAVERAEAPAAGQADRNYADGETMSPADYLAEAVTQDQNARVIIYTGNISLVVKDTQETVEAITQLANEQGGYVSDSNVYRAGEVLRGSVTIRIPAGRYQQVMEQLRGLALRVERESSSTEDVTEEYTDLQARKTNLEFTETALQQLLEERRRIGSTSDILEVQRELTSVRGQIEQIEGRMRYLANQAALSTISIELTPDVLYQPVAIGTWQPQGVAKEALQALIVALRSLTNLAIWLVIFVLPLLLLLLIPLAVAIWLVRLVWRRRKARQPRPKPAKTSPPPEDQ